VAGGAWGLALSLFHRLIGGTRGERHSRLVGPPARSAPAPLLERSATTPYGPDEIRSANDRLCKKASMPRLS